MPSTSVRLVGPLLLEGAFAAAALALAIIVAPVLLYVRKEAIFVVTACSRRAG